MTYVRYEPAFSAGSGGDSYFNKKKFFLFGYHFVKKIHLININFIW